MAELPAQKIAGVNGYEIQEGSFPFEIANGFERC
jgi:hypothetical protein